MSEVKPVEFISKNLQSFLDISPVQKEVLLLHKLQDHAYEQKNLLELKEDTLRQEILAGRKFGGFGSFDKNLPN